MALGRRGPSRHSSRRRRGHPGMVDGPRSGGGAPDRGRSARRRLTKVVPIWRAVPAMNESLSLTLSSLPSTGDAAKLGAWWDMLNQANERLLEVAGALSDAAV